VEVIKGVHWGGDFDMVMQMIKKNEIDANKIRFFIGIPVGVKASLVKN
jgi:hypothetical protein